MGPIQYISISDDAKTIVTPGSRDKDLQVWRCDLSSKTVSSGHILFMRHPPLSIECKKGCNEESGGVILAVSESGVAYVWHLNVSQDKEINPTKIIVKASQADVDLQDSVNAKKSRISIIAARLKALETDGHVVVLVSYGAIDSAQFGIINGRFLRESIVIPAGGATDTVRENGLPIEKGLHDSELEIEAASAQNKKRSEK